MYSSSRIQFWNKCMCVGLEWYYSSGTQFWDQQLLASPYILWRIVVQARCTQYILWRKMYSIYPVTQCSANKMYSIYSVTQCSRSKKINSYCLKSNMQHEKVQRPMFMYMQLIHCSVLIVICTKRSIHCWWWWSWWSQHWVCWTADPKLARRYFQITHNVRRHPN